MRLDSMGAVREVHKMMAFARVGQIKPAASYEHRHSTSFSLKMRTSS